MITNEGKERLGLVGNGSECSIFESLFAQTGIYRRNKDKWYFVNPNEKSDVYEVWKAIEDFCLSATDAPKSINMLIQILEAPPYGVKQGCIPVLLAAVLLSHSEDLTLYLDGAFIPVLGVEHFELLVRNPVRFSVKSLKMSGVNASIFKELQEGLFNSSYTRADKVWNATLLGVVKPLIAIVRKLPPYTLSTNRLSQEAISVRRALLTETEPDNLLFVALPQACGVVLSNADVTYDSQVARDFRQKLYKVLQEIQSAYSDLLMHCRELLHSAFALGSDLERLRGNLKVRTHYIKDRVLDPCLKSFVLAAANEEIDDTKWLEALLMVVADKPPRFWTDDDVLSFEARLSELVRRFTNLEALQDELSRAKLDGFDVRRVTLTLPDGKEMREVIWTELDQKDKINEIAEQILHDENLRYNEKLIKPVIISMIEKVLCRDNRKDDKSNTDLESQKEESEKVHD
ncbi:MAG: hypothetical protein Q8O10_10370 [candidate division Zixibacteria bacterium]|nr:hypothetical protein [candidate division Zixibacteria bacterium]